MGSPLASKALMPTHMCSDPLINPGCTVMSRKALLSKSQPTNNPLGTAIYSDQKGDLLIRYIWSQGNDFILDMQVVNMDVVSYV